VTHPVLPPILVDTENFPAKQQGQPNSCGIDCSAHSVRNNQNFRDSWNFDLVKFVKQTSRRPQNPVLRGNKWCSGGANRIFLGIAGFRCFKIG
jgi:hypothetical protein